MDSTSFTTVKAIDDYEGEACYCIEPGVALYTGDQLSKEAEGFWDNYPSKYNDAINPDTIKLFIRRIMQYGYIGTVSVNWQSNNSGANKYAKYYATQILIWETIVGERDENFKKINPKDSGKDNAKQVIQSNHPLRTEIFDYYDDIVTKVQNHTKTPSFTAKTKSKAQTVELVWNGSEYTATPAEGYKFYAWAEDGYILYGTPETYEITVNEDQALKALFVLDTEESVTISGTAYQLKTPGGNLGGVAPGLTVTLDNGYTTTTDTDGSFTFSNVESGAYLLTISGDSTIDRFVIVSTTDANTNVGNVAVACFDYVKDSVIDEQDTTAGGQWLSTNHTVSNVFADINADGVVTAKDLAYINKFKNKTKSDIYSEIIE